jgi:hypothetical protein
VEESLFDLALIAYARKPQSFFSFLHSLSLCSPCPLW